jgi:chromosome segregation ATPase
MVSKSVPADLDCGDLLAERIRESILGVESLREENRRLTDQVRSLEPTNLQLESEVQSLRLSLEQERAERRHYHSLANEIITRLDVVGQTIDDVVRRAEQETTRQRRESSRADLPEVEMPTFLKKVEALVNGHGEKPNGHAQSRDTAKPDPVLARPPQSPA